MTEPRKTIVKLPYIGPFLATRQGTFIAVFVTIQLLLPIHYYLSRDPHDERFAWRMFSPMRMTECTFEMKVGGRKLDVNAEFHEAWIEVGKRGRRSVLEAMAAYECKKNPNQPVTIKLDCTYLEHEPVSYGGFDLCDIPEL